MQLDGLWTVHALLALSGFALGNPVINDPMAAPRVFISFKGRNLRLILRSLSFLVCNWCFQLFSLSAGFSNSAGSPCD